MTKTNRAIFVATSAAALLLTGNVVARTTNAVAGDVKCLGINSCKGQGICASVNNSCKGKNTCKGKGVVAVSSADECVKKGGTVVPSK
jgi:uncharacterized membrane protein